MSLRHILIVYLVGGGLFVSWQILTSILHHDQCNVYALSSLQQCYDPDSMALNHLKMLWEDLVYTILIQDMSVLT